MHCWHRGHSFFSTNSEILEVYSKCNTAAEIITAQNAWLEQVTAQAPDWPTSDEDESDDDQSTKSNEEIYTDDGDHHPDALVAAAESDVGSDRKQQQQQEGSRELADTLQQQLQQASLEEVSEPAEVQ